MRASKSSSSSSSRSGAPVGVPSPAVAAAARSGHALGLPSRRRCSPRATACGDAVGAELLAEGAGGDEQCSREHDRASFQQWQRRRPSRPRSRCAGGAAREQPAASCSSRSAKLTKLDLVNYYVECEQAVVRGLRDRPTVMKRWVDGVEGKPFFQKRVPDSAPEWLQTATVTFPSGRHARELVPNDAAHLVWGVNLGVIDWNPWPVRRADLDHPDELRVDLDPQPDIPFAQVREVALCVREVLDEHGLRGLSQDLGLARHPRVRAPDARARLPAGAHGARWRSRARSSGACPAARRAAGGRRNARACSSTTTRTRATARSPRPTRCARWPTRACRARWSGTRSPTSSRRS